MLAGGRIRRCVSTGRRIDLKRQEQTFARRFGVKNVTSLHTRDKAEADKEIVAPLGPWRWRLVDSYMGTRS